MSTSESIKETRDKAVTDFYANEVILASGSTSTAGDTYNFPTAWQGALSPEEFLDINCTLFNSTCVALLNETRLANDTSNGTYGAPEGATEPLGDVIVMVALSVVLGLMILVTVIGNVFVIAAILLERNLQNVANYLIVSLAIADLLVACLVMPLGAVYVISNNWIMGPELCDMWTSSDVLCCTASILHLVAIAVDRYWAVTNVDYIHTRNKNRIVLMIVLVWSVALVVAFSSQIPQFGWKDPDYLYRINVKKQCLVNQDVAYQIFATCCTFYVPLLVILILYWQIFQTARKRIRRRREQRSQALKNSQGNGAKKNAPKGAFLKTRRFLRMKRHGEKSPDALTDSLVMIEGQSITTMEVLEEQDEKQSNGGEANGEETTAFTITKPRNQLDPLHNDNHNDAQLRTSNNVSPDKSGGTSGETTTNNGSASHRAASSNLRLNTDTTRLKEQPVKETSHHQVTSAPSRRDKKESIESKRERKAAKTLAIITGAFVVCWLPFFLTALLLPLCDSCNLSDYIVNFFLWLGYFNSTLNPVIYTVFNPEFRQAFKRILCGVHGPNRRRNFRSGKVR